MEEKQQQSTTSPPNATHEATTPAGQGKVDEEAVQKSHAALEFAAGAH
jgi:hypothetical protein